MPRVGRNRTKNLRMPKGWAPSRSGAIYFRPTNAQDRAIVKAITGGPLSLPLGATMDQAHQAFDRLIVSARVKETAAVPGFVSELVDRARRHYLPRIKNLETRAWRSRHVDALEAKFTSRRYARNVYEATKAPPGTFLMAMEIQRHLDDSGARPVAANREVKTWELVFEEARRRWGLTEYNPCSGMAFNPEAPRDVLPTDAGILKVYRKLDPPARFMVAMIRYYGRRKGEILGLQLQSADADGLHLRRGKAKDGRAAKEIVIRWDERLCRMWARLLRWREEHARGGKVETLAAIVNRDGGAYTVTGFNSAWRRAQVRAGVRGTFTFHDIRATRASTLSREDAVDVLAHDDPRTTTAIYRRGPHVIDMRPDANSRINSRNSRKGNT